MREPANIPNAPYAVSSSHQNINTKKPGKIKAFFDLIFHPQRSMLGLIAFLSASTISFLSLIGVAIVITLTIVFANALAPAEVSAESTRDYLIVVNEWTPYEFGGTYDVALQKDLVYLPDAYGEATLIESGTARAFQSLQADLLEKGMVIQLFNAYRSEADQQATYDYYSNLPGWSETNKAQLPGYSEHHTGLVVNLFIWYQGENDAMPTWYTESAERQESIPYFRLLHETLADHGFIDRYPRSKESITGVPCEPYEIRFVGSSEVAHEIMDSGLCLEEYVLTKK